MLELIKSNVKQRPTILQIRASSDKEERNRFKKALPVICWGGKFKERKNEAIIEPSHLIVLDFDNVDIAVKKKQLILLEFVLSCWVSPGGDGLKALVKVSSDNHLGHFKALSKEIGGVDESGKDISRACFMSWDANIYINTSATVYTKIIESVYTDEQKLEKLKKWLENKGEMFVSGNRNNFLAKLAGACNRFGLSKMFVESVVIRDYCGSGFAEREAKGVIDSMYRHSEEFGTESFDQVFSEKKVVQILNGQVAVRDAIYLDEVRDDLLKDYNEGTKIAGTTYFPSIDPIFRPLPGDLTVLCGIGNHGKSAFKKQMDLVTSVKEGRKHAFFSPEEVPPLFWYRELIRAYVGKPIEKEHKNRMTLDEYKKGMDFVREHFVFVYPPTLPTPDYILERFAEVIIKDGVKSVTLDPWNQLLHIMDKRDDIYLGEVLSKFERFAQQHNIYFTVICHPNKTQKDAEGNYACPDIYDLNGGPVWNARSTNITCLHRPYWGVDKADPTVEFHSKKIKRQMISGVPGIASLGFDRSTGRFLDTGYNPLFDHKI